MDAEPRIRLSFITIFGLLLLIGSASVYAAYGLSAYPRQEWLVESLAAVIFLIPVINFLRGKAPISHSVRIIGVALILHSVWDAVHWPTQPLIHTPIDSWIPQICPILNIVLGLMLLIRGEKTAQSDA